MPKKQVAKSAQEAKTPRRSTRLSTRSNIGMGTPAVITQSVEGRTSEGEPKGKGDEQSVESQSVETGEQEKRDAIESGKD